MTRSINQKQVYCVIVSYNGEKWLSKALDSLSASTHPSKVIVVDNASSDNTTTYVQKQFPGVTLIALDENLGFGRANNIGIAKALEEGADYIFLLNQDAFIHQDCIKELVCFCEDNSETGIVSPLQLNYDGKGLENHFCNYVWECAPEFFSDLYVNQLEQGYTVHGAPAALWLIRREGLLDVGGFDPIFFLYGEDDDLAARMRDRGWSIEICTAAKGFHFSNPHDTPEALIRRQYYHYFGTLIQILKENNVSLPKKLFRFFRYIILTCITISINLQGQRLLQFSKAFFSLVLMPGNVWQSVHCSQHAKAPFLDITCK